MIKIKIHEPLMGKNRISFQGFLMLKDMFRDYSIDITDSDDFDYMFLGAYNILDKGIGLQESIEYGLKSINDLARGGDCFIFDGSDSTSIMGGIEVVRNTNPIYYFKNQFLDFDLYKNPNNFGRWFWGRGENDLSYDLSKEERDKMKLSGWNLGHLQVHLFNNSILF